MTEKTVTQVYQIPFSDPLIIFNALHHHKWSLFLDSALNNSDYGRYSYIAIRPFKTLTAKNGDILIDNTHVKKGTNPFDILRTFLAEMPQPFIDDLPPFQGGAAGTFAYDLYQYIENIPLHQSDDIAFPDMAIGLYDVVISFDHLQNKAWIISTGWPEKTLSERSARAITRLHEFKALIAAVNDYATTPHANKKNLNQTSSIDIHSNFNPTQYKSAIKRVIDHIYAGDIFQANISQRFQGTLPTETSAFDLYLELRKINPAPFAAFMNLGQHCVASASPERFIKLTDYKVETRPIKGTRPRGHNKMQDQLLAAALQQSQKDIAENIMIVDLLRNDLSKVCKDFSVKVTQLCGLESYATVHHLVSVVTGELQLHHNAIDLLLATFPGGSITGAPKIRAMQIIADIEPTQRGIYCGSIGFISFNGSMDTSIAIRTYTVKDNIVTFQAGGGIVADSNEDDEYQETLIKITALQQSLNRLL
jgi:para-aminobenzoate synthetase component 1